jgi:hypothetical protein
MKLIQDLSFSGLIHENPFDHVRSYECSVETQGKTGVSSDARKRDFFSCYPSLGKQGIGIVVLVETTSCGRV